MPENDIPDPDVDLDEGQHDSPPEWKAPASQEELDRLINKATARAHAKYKDYDAVKERASLYDQLLAQTQTDQERAAADAEKRARADAAGQFVPRLVKSEFRAAAKGVLDSEALEMLLEDVDLTRYVTADGEPDLERIERKIKALSPKTPPPDFGQGNRGNAPKGVNMDNFIRQQSGILPAR